MPRQPQAASAETAPEKQNETPEPQTARRPSQTQKASRENAVVEGQVPQLELYVPEPINPENLAKLNVYQRWNAMIGEMGIIPKRGWNNHHKYWFTTDADLNAFIGPLLSKYHLVVIPRLMLDKIERFETAGKQFVTRVPMEIDVINVDTPDDRFTVPWAGEGGDMVDKGLYKGFTGGLKYFFMKTLQVATGDDPETFARTDQLAEDSSRAAQGAPQGRPVQVRQSNAPQPERGGRQNEVTAAQLNQVGVLGRALGWGPRGVAEEFDRIHGTAIYPTIDALDDEKEQSRTLAAFLKTKTGEDVGKLLHAMGEEISKRAAAKTEGQAVEEGAAHDGYEG